MLQTIRIRKPHVPHGPKGVEPDEATANYLVGAAERVRHERWWGSNVSNTIATMIEDAVRALRAPNAEDREAHEDTETLRRIIDSACGTDAAHFLIAKALREAGWVGPEQHAKVTAAYVEHRTKVERRDDALHETREAITEWRADLDDLFAEYRSSVDPAPYTTERAFVERAEAIVDRIGTSVARVADDG